MKFHNDNIIQDKIEYMKKVSSDHFKYSFNKEKQLKSSHEIFTDLMSWYIKYQEIDRNYFLRGADIKNSQTFNYPTKLCIKIREQLNNTHDESGLNYTPLLLDKYIAWITFEKSKIKSPKVYAVSNKNHLKWIQKPQNGNLIFIKKRYGIGGSSIASGYIENDFLINKDGKTPLQKLINNESVIIQEKVCQHVDINTINPNSINTIKITTSISINGDVTPHFSFIRLGTSKSGIMDNFSKGSIIFNIDMNKGTLASKGHYKYAFYDPNGIGLTSSHPDTGINLSGFKIPNYKECIQLATTAHKEFPYIFSIGWDIALTPQGPIIIEGNPRWDTAFAQISAGHQIIEEIFNHPDELKQFRRSLNINPPLNSSHSL